MSMNYDTTHEYNMIDGTIHWCENHETLLVISHTGGSTQRLLIEGLTKDDINNFRLELNKEQLEAVAD